MRTSQPVAEKNDQQDFEEVQVGDRRPDHRLRLILTELGMAVDRIQLLGIYQTPQFKTGDVVSCALRGNVTVMGTTSARIPWPTGKRIDGRKNSTPAIILCDGLIEAVQNESNQAVCHWWGVTGQTVSLWRKALEIGRANPGTSKLYTANYRDHVGEAMRKAAFPTLRSGEPKSPPPNLADRDLTLWSGTSPRMAQ